jgi:hypothetical protein
MATRRTLRMKTVRRKHAAKPVARVAKGARKPEIKLAPEDHKALQDALVPPRAEVTAFEMGDVNQKAPLLTLVSALFEAPNMPAKFADPAADFMANALMSISDEVELTAAANNGLDLGEVKDRAAMRTEWRARIAVEIARRMQTGEVMS